MSAVLEAIVDLAEPEAAAQSIHALNDRLAAERTIPPEIADAVRAIAAGVDQTHLRRWEAIDPRHAVILLHGAVSAQRALEEPESPTARDQLRIALESIRQALSALAERQPVSDDRSPKAVVQWLAERAEVSQSKLAELLGVSLRQLQRWLSSAEAVEPEGEDARKARLVAKIVNELRFVLTPAGTIDWFYWTREDLGSRRPVDLLGDPEQEPELSMASAGMRSSLAG